MSQLSYSFCMSMLHSLWQGGLLLLAYLLFDTFLFRNKSPLAKRNFIFMLLAAQLALTAITFILYFISAPGGLAITGEVNRLLNLTPGDNMNRVTTWLFTAYLLILGYKATKACLGWYRFRQQYRAGLQKPGLDLKLFTAAKAYHFGIRRKVTLWLSNTINTPVTFGFFKPVILLPVALLNNISAAQAETLVLHELSHIRANDYLLNWFLLAAEHIFFFNPFVASLCKKIRLEREKNCDVSVIAFEYPAALYASTLLQAERIKQAIPNFQLAAVSRKKQLLHRIQYFTGDKVFNTQKQIRLMAPLTALVFICALYAMLLLFSPARSAAPAASATTAGIFPVNTTELSNLVIENNTMPGISDKGLRAIEAKMAKEKRNIDRQVKKMQPLIKTVAQNAKKLAEQVSLNFIVPAAEKENDAARQIIVKEEASGSKAASVKVYWLRFVNGQWVIQPDWMLSAKQAAAEDDTTNPVHDSSVKARKVYSQQ